MVVTGKQGKLPVSLYNLTLKRYRANITWLKKFQIYIK